MTVHITASESFGKCIFCESATHGAKLVVRQGLCPVVLDLCDPCKAYIKLGDIGRDLMMLNIDRQMQEFRFGEIN